MLCWEAALSAGIRRFLRPACNHWNRQCVLQHAGFVRQRKREFERYMPVKDLSPEVKKTLDALREKGLKLAIGSISKNTKYILKQIGLEGFFDAISGGTNIVQSKPNPEVFLKAAQYLGEKPESCLVIEDAQTGIDAAVAGNFDSAGIGSAPHYDRASYKLTRFKNILESG